MFIIMGKEKGLGIWRIYFILIEYIYVIKCFRFLGIKIKDYFYFLCV